ncbi:MAG: hypothetical protein AAFQ81_07300 [Pseudomonadota bacterium]
MGSRQEPLSAALADALAAVEAAVAHVARPLDLHDWDPVAREDKARILSRGRDELTPHDLYMYVVEGPNELPLHEAQWFLPALCRHLACCKTCGDPVGSEFAFGLLSQSGFPERWPDRSVAAVERFLSALVADFLEYPDRWQASLGGEFEDGLPLFFQMAEHGRIGLRSVVDGAAAVPEAALARAIARWTLHTHPPSYDLIGGEGFEERAGQLAAHAFLSPGGMDFTKSWLVLQEPWIIIPRALEGETEPEWQDVLDEAATLWAAAARDGREGRAVSPWRSRSRYLRRYRARPRRRSGPGPTTG